MGEGGRRIEREVERTESVDTQFGRGGRGGGKKFFGRLNAHPVW